MTTNHKLRTLLTVARPGIAVAPAPAVSGAGDAAVRITQVFPDVVTARAHRC